MHSRLPKILFVALAAYAVVYFYSSYARLPSVLASHFNAQGRPNGWETKPVFFAVFGSTVLIAALIGIGGAWLIRVLPPELINLPNKQQWLGPAFREATLEYLSSWFAWFGCALLLLLILTFNYAVQVNLHPAHPPDASRFWYYLGGFSIFTIICMVRLMTRFGRPPRLDTHSNP